MATTNKTASVTKQASVKKTQVGDARESNKKPEQVSVYGLCHPITGELRYIGKANNIARRLLTHLSEGRTRKRPVNCWIASLIKQGLQPKIFEIESVPSDAWQATEAHWIAYFRSLGANLLNIADGGDQPKTNPEQLARNGRIAAQKRDPYIWSWKRFIGSSIKFGRENGIDSMVERGEQALRLVASFTPEQAQRFSSKLRATFETA